MDYFAEAARCLKKAEEYISSSAGGESALRYERWSEMARLYTNLATAKSEAENWMMSGAHHHSMQGDGGVTTGPAIPE